MSYEASLDRLPNFLRYVNKVYGFSRIVNSMQGNRNSEGIPPDHIHECVPMYAAAPGFIAAVGSGCRSRQDTEILAQR